ncbi:MAG: aminoacyl-tRNA deacylase [Nitriliruptorales bacterium]
MTAERLRQYLDENGVAYEEHEHEEVFTAQEVAAAEHVTGWRVAKPVMLRMGDDLVMAVVPAAEQVDLARVTSVLGGEVRLADESEFGDVFSDCDLGAEPPFGELYDVAVVVDERLTDEPEIEFRACSHRRSMRLSTEDYLRVADRPVAAIGVPAD